MHQPSPQPNSSTSPTGTSFSRDFWLLVLLTGIGTGIGAGLLMKLLRLVQHAAWSYHHGIFLLGVLGTSSLHRVTVLVIGGVVAGVSLWAIRRVTHEKGPDLTAGIWFHSGKLPLLRTTLRAVLSMVLVGLGASIGREEAPKQIGAVAGNLLSHWKKLPSMEQRLLVACGAGAGMGAVYNVPFGGALFALEVLLGTLTLPFMLPALVTSCIATVVSWLFLPIQPTYFIHSYPLSAPLVVWAVIMSPVLGAASALYARFIAAAHAHAPKNKGRFVVPVLAFAFVGLLAIHYPQILGNGKDLVQQTFVGQDGALLLLVLLFLKPLATGVSLGSGIPGGLFTPTLTFGALLGGLLGYIWALVWPGQPPGVYAVIGAGAVLAAATQGPLSAIVLLFELTHHIVPLMIPLLLAVSGATWTARKIDSRSIYSGRISKEGTARTGSSEETAEKGSPERTAPCLSISGGASYEVVIEHMLSKNPLGRPIYVVDEEGKLEGVISNTDLPTSDSPFVSSFAPATASDLAQPAHPLKASLSAEEKQKKLFDSGCSELPVVDDESGELKGCVQADKQFMAEEGRQDE